MQPDSNVPELIASAEIIDDPGSTVPGERYPCWVVKISWSSPQVTIDRPSTYSISVKREHLKLAERLKRAVNDQKVFYNPKIATDVNGKTYVQSGCHVMGRYLNADLKRLGY